MTAAYDRKHGCTICIIPVLRGQLMSRPIDEVMQDMKKEHNKQLKSGPLNRYTVFAAL